MNVVSNVRWSSRPKVTQPIVVAAFEGWNDAGDAATAAIAHLTDSWNAAFFADLDPEEFYDFTVSRPRVRIVDLEQRAVDWPENTFSLARPPAAPDVVLIRGIEPQLKWRTFCDEIISVANDLNARLVMTLGALLADVAHTRPTSVFGTAYDPAVVKALHLEPSRYEGPTGIVGVLHDQCAKAGLNSASLWAAVPSYVPAAPSPKAALAMVDRVCSILGTTTPTGSLEAESVQYEQQISELVEEDDDTVAYVKHLEETYDREGIAEHKADELVAEVERFLRDQ